MVWAAIAHNFKSRQVPIQPARTVNKIRIPGVRLDKFTYSDWILRGRLNDQVYRLRAEGRGAVLVVEDNAPPRAGDAKDTRDILRIYRLGM